MIGKPREPLKDQVAAMVILVDEQGLTPEEAYREIGIKRTVGRYAAQRQYDVAKGNISDVYDSSLMDQWVRMVNNEPIEKAAAELRMKENSIRSNANLYQKCKVDQQDPQVQAEGRRLADAVIANLTTALSDDSPTQITQQREINIEVANVLLELLKAAAAEKQIDDAIRLSAEIHSWHADSGGKDAND